jgi:hypothetical protein
MTSTHNALALRMIQKITPPNLLYVNKERYNKYLCFHVSLLHRAYALCGRALCMLLFGLMLFVGVGCSKDDISPMHQMYNESIGLPSTSIDSVKTFTTKFSNYLKANPAGWNDEYCNPTIENMKYACSVFGYKLEITSVAFLLNTEWEDEMVIKF